MPVDLYVNKSVAELETLLALLQDAQTSGTITEVTVAGVRTVRQAPSHKSLKSSILNVRYSLFLRDPEAYSNPYLEQIRRTSPSYNT